MKKIRILFLPLIAIALFSLNSCGPDESLDGFEENTESTTPNTPTNPGDGSSLVLLKKTIDTYSDGSKNTIIYTYSGNKIVSAIDDSGEINAYFTYTGDLITKIEYKEDGKIAQVDSFTYNSNGKLASFTRQVTTDGLGTFIDCKEIYTHNTDGSISVVEESGNNYTATIKFVNGEVSEIINSNTSLSHVYTYDAKNNPFKNVTGYGKISFYDSEADGIMLNIISNENTTQSYNYIYTYNSNNFPITATETDNTGDVVKTQFFY